MGEISARIMTKPRDNAQFRSQTFNRNLCGIAKWLLFVLFFLDIHCNKAFS